MHGKPGFFKKAIGGPAVWPFGEKIILSQNAVSFYQSLRIRSKIFSAMRKLLPLSFCQGLFLLISLPITAQSPQQMVQRVTAHFAEKHHQFASEDDVWGDYTLDLTLDALLVYSKASGETAHLALIQNVFDKRRLTPKDTIAYQSQPFCSVNFTQYEYSGDKTYLAPYLYESAKMRQDASFSPEGAITHTHRGVKGHYILIDYMQEFASRMAKAGMISGDTSYYGLSVRQFRLYRQLLRNPQTGLWSQGRGWKLDPQALSPGAWSRGHGWLLRGLVGTLRYLPKGSAWHREAQGILVETVDALLKVQDGDGMWHQLLDRPFSESTPESSGTGLIAYNIALALQDGMLQGKKYEDAVKKAAKGLREYVTKEGVVLNTCKGPGPLDSTEGYLGVTPDPDDPHGPPAIIYAMTAELLLEKARK